MSADHVSSTATGTKAKAESLVATMTEHLSRIQRPTRSKSCTYYAAIVQACFEPGPRFDHARSIFACSDERGTKYPQLVPQQVAQGQQNLQQGRSPTVSHYLNISSAAMRNLTRFAPKNEQYGGLSKTDGQKQRMMQSRAILRVLSYIEWGFWAKSVNCTQFNITNYEAPYV